MWRQVEYCRFLLPPPPLQLNSYRRQAKDALAKHCFIRSVVSHPLQPTALFRATPPSLSLCQETWSQP